MNGFFADETEFSISSTLDRFTDLLEIDIIAEGMQNILLSIENRGGRFFNRTLQVGKDEQCLLPLSLSYHFVHRIWWTPLIIFLMTPSPLDGKEG